MLGAAAPGGTDDRGPSRTRGPPIVHTVRVSIGAVGADCVPFSLARALTTAVVDHYFFFGVDDDFGPS